jgi:hypothetical protein
VRRLLLAAFLMSSCALAPGSAPTASPTTAPATAPAGISREDAIRMASGHLAAGDPVLVSATQGQSAQWGPLDHPNVAAWILRFTGNFPMECPAPAANCPDLHSAVIVLDAQTGEFISGTYTE